MREGLLCYCRFLCNPVYLKRTCLCGAGDSVGWLGADRYRVPARLSSVPNLELAHQTEYRSLRHPGGTGWLASCRKVAQGAHHYPTVDFRWQVSGMIQLRLS